jgi:glutathione S-transferase
MPTLCDAERCPYCARVRIVLAEKRVPYETVLVNLDERPAWIIEKNPPRGRVPVWEEDGFVLPESDVIMEYLEERWPEPALLAADPADRALARLAIFRFAERLGDDYYDYRRGEAGAAERLDARLRALDADLHARPFLGGGAFGLADAAYVPWVLRIRERFAMALDPYPALHAWLTRLEERPSVAAEVGPAGAV